MAKFGKLITDLSVKGKIVALIFECASDDAARELYDGLRGSVEVGRIELTNSSAEAEEVTVQ